MKKIKERNIYGILLALTGAVFMCIGIFKGEPASVMAKAIRICLECIGIG